MAATVDDAGAIAAIRAGARGMQTREWSDHVKHLAYELWAGAGNMDARKVATLLSDPAREDDGYDVPERTIYRWARDDNWEVRRAQEIADAAPLSLHRTFMEMVADGIVARRIVRAIMDKYERGEPLDARDKIALDAAKTDLDRIGLSPRTTIPAKPESIRTGGEDHDATEDPYDTIMRYRSTQSGPFKPR